MTTKYLSGSYPTYTITAPVTLLEVTHTGYVGTLTAPNGVSIYNLGRIGVIGAKGGGIHGGDSVTVRNGSALYPGETIGGGGISLGYKSVVDNFGTIDCVTGVKLKSGSLVNGGGNDTGALIEGATGVILSLGAGTVANFGSILGMSGKYSVFLDKGGSLTNGTQVDTQALIRGSTAVEIALAAGTVTNFGELVSTGPSGGGFGVELLAGGTVINGGANDHTALIEGYYTGVQIKGGAGTVTNLGTIEGQGVSGGPWGIDLDGGGTVTNGTGQDHAALVQGYGGIVLAGAAGAVRNYGTVFGTGGVLYYGIDLTAGGSLTNGWVNDTAALIEGYSGVALGSGASAANFGVIQGTGPFGGRGVFLEGAGVRLTNGGANSTAATVEGYNGVVMEGASTFTNFGTVEGASGVAVRLLDASGTLVVEARSSFVGAVHGYGATLSLGSGVGSLTGQLSSGSVTVSGSMAATTFSGFDTFEVASGANFTMAGAVSISNQQTVIDAGVLTINAGAATIANAGTIEVTKGAAIIDSAVKNTGAMIASGGNLTVQGAVTGAGTVSVSGATADFAGAFAENVTFGASGVLELAKSQTYTGKVTGFSKTGKTSFDLLDIAFGSKTTAKFAGSASSGVLTVTDGTHIAKITLEGDYAGSTFTVASDGHGGTKVVDPSKASPQLLPPMPMLHPFIAAAASLGANGGPMWLAEATWRTCPPGLATPKA